MSDEMMIATVFAMGLAACFGAWLWRASLRWSNELRAVRGLDGMHLEVTVQKT